MDIQLNNSSDLHLDFVEGTTRDFHTSGARQFVPTCELFSAHAGRTLIVSIQIVQLQISVVDSAHFVIHYSCLKSFLFNLSAFGSVF